MTDEIAAIEARAEALVESHDKLLADLIALRTKHHLSQLDVAIRMGVTQPTVSAFEKYDANPRLSTIRRYALAVNALIDHEVIDDCIPRTVTFDAVTTGAVPRWVAPIQRGYRNAFSTTNARVIDVVR